MSEARLLRQEESERGASFYDQVYTASRPELFFKATPSRVAGPGEPIRVRSDSKWSVPEPELALVLSPETRSSSDSRSAMTSARGTSRGRTRSICRRRNCTMPAVRIGPCITLTGAMPARAEIGIRLEIRRAGNRVYAGETSLARMARGFEDLIDWLGRDNQFPDGVILLTGTGIVPPDEFSLEAGDEVHITIDGVGTLSNPVIRG